MHNLPLSVDPLVDLRAVPTGGGLRPAVELRSVIDEVERQHGHITLPLNLRIDDLNALDSDLAGERREKFSQRFATVNSPFGHRIEVGFVLGHDFEEPFGVAFPPTIKCATLERDDVLR